MLSAVIEAGEDGRALAATLTALVPAAADGVLRDVVLAAGRPDPGIAAIADALGCDLVAGGLAAALAVARQPWVLRLAPGDRPEAGWADEASAFIERCGRAGLRDRAGLFQIVLDEAGPAARLRELMLNRGGGMRRPMIAPAAALIAGTRLTPVRVAARLRRGY